MEEKRLVNYFRDLVYLEKIGCLLSMYMRQLKIQLSRLHPVLDRENDMQVSDIMLETWRENRMLFVSTAVTGSAVIWVMDRIYVLDLLSALAYEKFLPQEYLLREFIMSACVSLLLSACAVCGGLFLFSLRKKYKNRSEASKAFIIGNFPTDKLGDFETRILMKSYLSEQSDLAIMQWIEMHIAFERLLDLFSPTMQFDNLVDRFLIYQYLRDGRCTGLKGKNGVYALLLKDKNRRRAKRRIAKDLLPKEIPELAAEIDVIKQTIRRINEENWRICCSGETCGNAFFSDLSEEFKRERRRIEADMPLYEATLRKFRKNPQ